MGIGEGGAGGHGIGGFGIDGSRIEELAEALWHAERTRDPIPQPSAELMELTLEDAYAVQGIGIARRVADGETVIGRKVGLTSLAMQQQLGVDQPDFGVITDAMAVPNGGGLDLSELISAKLEPEFAFRIDAELPQSPTIEQVRAAIGAVALSLEVIDSRVRDWRIGLVDTVADNASSARIVLGEWREATPELLGQLPGIEIAFDRDGERVGSGPGSAVLGDPVNAVHWLATAIGAFGQSFARGSVVLAGAVTAAAPVAPGQAWRATAPGFEPVSVTAR